MVKILVDPLKSRYDIGDVIEVDYIVLDWNGNVLNGVGATWQHPAEEQVRHLGNNRFEFSRIGSFTWKVTLDSPKALTDTVTLIVPAVPMEVDITVDPAQDFYEIGDQVTMGYVVYDQEHNEMTGIGATWQNPTPAEARADGADQFTLLRDGYLTWTVTLEDPYGLSDTETLTVDGSGPQIVIQIPERGDTIRKLAAGAEITVQGQVTDEMTGVDSLTIHTNAMPETQVSVQLDGSFSLVTPAVQGLNVVVVEAVDTAGNSSVVTRGYHYASDFFAYQNDTEGRSELGELTSVWLTRMALDRGKPTDNPPYDPCDYDASDQYVCTEIRDVATLLELALNNLDFATSQPTQDFNFPIVDEAWTFDLTDDIEVKAALVGDFDLVFGFEHIRAGLAKVDELASYDGGVHAGFDYSTYKDSSQEDRPGLDIAYGMTATLTFNVWLDLTATDPLIQVGLCILADVLCNPDPPNDCLSDYLIACSGAATTPIAGSISSIDTPMLAGLSVDRMEADLDLDVGLDISQEPAVTLADLEVDMGQGTLDVSVLEDITINIGTIRFASFEIDLGTWQFPSNFISDLADQLLDPLVNAIKPIIEFALNEFFTCTDPENPVCYVIPFLENLFAAFAVDETVAIDNPFDGSPAMATLHFLTGHDLLQFTTQRGGDMKLSARIDSERDPGLDQHCDDDMLGIALCDGCFAGAGDFTGYDVGTKSIQIAHALDLINMELFAIWNNGGFDLTLDEGDFDLPEEFSVRDLEIQLRPWLPPMLTACEASQEQVQVEIGDLQVSAQITTQANAQMSYDGFVSLIVPADLIGNPAADGFGVQLGSDPDFGAAELTSLTVDGQPADEASKTAVLQMVREHVGMQVLEAVSALGLDRLQVLTPEWDISAFLGQAPGTTSLTLGAFGIHQDQNHAIGNGDFVQ